MIQVKPRALAELRGSERFKFKSDINCQVSKDYNNDSISELLIKNRILGEIRAQIEQFQMLPCEVSMTIGVENGQQVMEGEINAFTRSSKSEAEQIMEQVNHLTFNFSREYESSSFSIKVTQTITITEVHYADGFPRA